jgi:rubrerythrin
MEQTQEKFINIKCGHSFFCGPCSNKLKRKPCPFCKAPNSQFIKFFKV